MTLIISVENLFSVETDTFFLFLKDDNFMKQHLFEIEICSIINVCTVMFISLLVPC